ncbi:MAG: efflux RND transporter periplasmic adaptor subunit [bacterium]
MDRYLFRVVTISMLAGLWLTGCDQEQAALPTPPPPEVIVKAVVAKDTPVAPEFVGKTVSSRKVEIRSRVEGFLEKRLYTEGDWVDEGQPLFQMDQKPFQAQLDAAKAELAQQQARLDTAKAELERVEPLAKKNAVAQKELDDALGTYRSAAASVEVAKANVIQSELNLGYTLISSPVSGISSYAVQQEGAYIGLGSGSLLTYVAQIDPIWVEFSVSENQVLAFRKQTRAGIVIPAKDQHYTVNILLADGNEYPHTGEITFADASISERTGTFLMRASLPNPDSQLRPGQFVRAFVNGSHRPNAIKVPQRAVQQGPTGSFVWVVNAEQKAELRPVEVGPWHGDEWFIDKGLKDGDRVVIEGAAKLKPDLPVTIVSDKKS